MHPDLWPPRPVGVQIALWIAPESMRHPRPRFRDRQFPHFSPHRLAIGVKNFGGDPKAGASEGTGLTGLQDRAPHNPAGHLGPSGVVDDRAAPLADLLEVPEIGIRCPRLTG